MGQSLASRGVEKSSQRRGDSARRTGSVGNALACLGCRALDLLFQLGTWVEE